MILLKNIKLMILLMFLVVKMSSFSIGIEPTVFGKEISQGNTGYKEYTIKNETEERVRYKIEIESLEKDRDKFDIEVYPKVVLLEPLENKKIKVLIKSKSTVKDGEYQFTMGLSPIKVPVLNKQEKDTIDIKLGGEVGVGLAVGLIGYVGDLGNSKEDVQILNIKNENNKVSFEVDNKMRKSLKINARIRKTNTSYEDFTHILRIDKNSKKKIELELKNIDNPKGIEIYDAESGEILLRKSL